MGVKCEGNRSQVDKSMPVVRVMPAVIQVERSAHPLLSRHRWKLKPGPRKLPAACSTSPRMVLTLALTSYISAAMAGEYFRLWMTKGVFYFSNVLQVLHIRYHHDEHASLCNSHDVATFRFRRDSLSQ
jgi:hypothetical protein